MVYSRFTASCRFRSVVLAAIACTILPVLAGCPDLTQVQQLSKTADQGQTSANALAADFAGTCSRDNLYVHVPSGQFNDLAAAPPKACINAADLESIGKNQIAAQTVLFAYFDALGRLASTDATGFEAAAPKLDSGFKTAGLSATQQDMAAASGTLASLVTKVVTAGYRAHEVEKLLQEADPAVQTLTLALANMIAPAGVNKDQPCPLPAPNPQQKIPEISYFGLLCNEQGVVNLYYQGPLNADSQSLAAILVSSEYKTALDQLKTHMDAASAYRTLMLSLGSAHAKLVADSKKGNFDKATIKRIASDLSEPMSDATDAVNKLQKELR
jgi:hypothetical protein